MSRPALLNIGYGNLVVADRGFDGLVMRLVGDFVAIEVAPDGTIVVPSATQGQPLASFTMSGAATDNVGVGGAGFDQLHRHVAAEANLWRRLRHCPPIPGSGRD